MKSANAIKKITSLLLGATIAFTSLGLSDIAETVKAATTATETANGTVTTFKANLFDYDQTTMNTATLKLVANKMAAANYTFSGEQLQTSYPALLFTECGGLKGNSASYSATSYVNGWYQDNRGKWQQGWHNETNTYTIYDRNFYNAETKTSSGYTSKAPWNACMYGTGTKGIADKTLTNGLPTFSGYTVADLFDTSVTSDKSVYKDTDVEFVYQDGYYVLDSAEYSYTYNKSANKVTSKKNGSSNGFWPFGSSDYHFGMDLSVDFLMTKSGTYDMDGDGEEEDCVFKFSGDDDVWVYIDDTLALDLGGIHDAIYGQIDFKNQKVEYTDKYGNVTSSVAFSDLGENGLSVNDNQTHTLSVFYLERGAGASNCKITFNFPTVNTDVTGDYTLAKIDGTTEAALSGASFDLYSDSACTTKVASATSGSDGLVTFKDIKTGTYYLKETAAPTGYELSDTVYQLILAGNSSQTLTSVLTDTSDGKTVGDTYTTGGKTYTAIKNYNGSGTGTTVDKTAKLVNWSDRTYKITLDANSLTKEIEETSETVTTPVDVVMVIDSSKSMLFPADLQKVNRGSSRLDTKKTYYFVKDGAAATVYRIYYSNSSDKWYYTDSSVSTNDYKNTITETSNYGSYTYKFGSQTISQFYTSKSGGTDTRLKELIPAAQNFVDDLPDGSKLGIVWFYSSCGTLNLDNNTYTTDDVVTLSSSNRSTVKNAIATIADQLGSGTDQSLGMSKALTMLQNKMTDSNSKYTVLLTDGCPTGTYSTTYNNINGTSGSATKMKASDVTVMTIGIDINDFMSDADTLLKDTASYVGDSTTDKYYYSTDSSKISDVFDQLTQEIKKTSSKLVSQSGKVVDVIDSRFELTEESKAALEKVAEVSVSEKTGETTITWKDASLNNWTANFCVKAKDNYVGGNDITTNTADSGVTVNGTFYAFPQPKVNVRINLEAGDAEDTIFLGQSLADYFTQYQMDQVYTEADLDDQDVNIVYKWTEVSDGVKTEKTGDLDAFAEYVRSQSPEEDTVYYLNVTATPKTGDKDQATKDAADAMMNSDYVDYTASMASSADAGKGLTSVTVTGSYTVYVIDGQITIAKTFDGDYLDGLGYSDHERELIDAEQTAVFTVYRYAEDATEKEIKDGTAKVLDQYQITITGDGEKTIKGLKAGMYRVVEETDWSWSYELTGTTENASVNDKNSKLNDGIFYLGQTIQNNKGTEKNTVVIQQKEMKVSLTNKLYSFAKHVYADTTNVLNKFVSAVSAKQGE